MDYFSDPAKKPGTINEALRGAVPVVTTNKMPIILQYKGHSVTVIGYEVSKQEDVTLLVFDPSRSIKEKYRGAALAGPRHVTWASSSKTSSMFRVGQRRVRERSPSLPSRKRARLNTHLDEGVIVISDSDADEKIDQDDNNFTLSAEHVVKTFRWKMSRLWSVSDIASLTSSHGPRF
ncbi:hypothetical protein ID866_5106 [Astraeus odoratus]|nr:hypothetical protein ID866_5106 [Astraeus odoratus]